MASESTDGHAHDVEPVVVASAPATSTVTTTVITDVLSFPPPHTSTDFRSGDVVTVTEPLDALMDPLAESGPLYIEINNSDTISAPTSPVRKPAQSGSQDLPSPCQHPCTMCGNIFTTTLEFNNHCKAYHPSDYAKMYRTWVTMKKTDSLEWYRRMKKRSTCPRCHGFMIDGTNLSE